MEKAGYIPTAHFILPENCWLEHFYAPQFPVQEAFLKEYAGNDAAADLITGQRYEESLYVIECSHELNALEGQK